MRLALSLVLMLLPAPVLAQESLADIKSDLATLSAAVTSLRQELVTTGASGTGQLAGSALDRMNAIEAQLSQLTAKTEALEIRINKIVTDGTNRIGDLEFRVCEMEQGCDPAAIGTTLPLGGATASAVPSVTPPKDEKPDMAVGEQADFDKAKKAFDANDYKTAAKLFGDYVQTYPGGALRGDANYYRGEALMAMGDTGNAARAWLESFSGAPNGGHAPDALLKLGLALNSLGQTAESCVTLAEVPGRYPGTDAAKQANDARVSMGCG